MDGPIEPEAERGPNPDRDEVAALRAIVEGTARGTGTEFFQSLVHHLARALDVNYAFVAEFAGSPTRVRTIANWARGRIKDNAEYELAGTPCEDVMRGGLCHHPQRVRDKFPTDQDLIDLAIESYLGVPLLDGDGQVLGHLAVYDDRPMPAEPRPLFIFRIFAARAAAELERLRVEKQLLESERRYRELYEEAPNAYVAIGLDRRLLSVNHRATQLLGAPADELVGRPVLAMFAESPAERPSAEEALGDAFDGREVSGRELEMRRPDGGVLWVSVWIRPLRGADGRITAVHSIWVDITDRVRAEAELRRPSSAERLPPGGAQVGPQLRRDRRPVPLAAGRARQGQPGGADRRHRADHRRDRDRQGTDRAGDPLARPARAKPLIKVNCAALPAGLIESELFGHEKGAFTGAIARRFGRFELADGGTLFLDEIGELPLETQAKLLRVLQEHEIERVGGGTTIKVDVRIIAATNRDLLKAVAEARFREDLYYRLSVFPIAMPPLRDRAEDIPLLVRFLVDKFAARIGRRIEEVSPQTMRRLVAYRWPGNIRELENILERAVILATGPTLEIEIDAEPPLGAAPSEDPPTSAPIASLEATERRHILDVLRQTQWVIDGPRGAAQILGLHPNTLRSRLKKLGITRTSHEPS